MAPSERQSAKMVLPIRIGVLVTSSFTTEIIKYEYFPLQMQNRPWLKATPAKIQFPYKEKTWARPHQCVTSDGAVVSYLKWIIEKHAGTKNVQVEPIFPRELTKALATTFDLIFCPMVDILEYATIAPQHEQARFQKVLKTVPNIYPSYKVQKLINDKAAYYHFFTKRGIPMIDTITFKKKDIRTQRGLQHCLQIIRKRAQKNQWLKIVVKPNSGQEGLRFSVLPENVDDDRLANALQDILSSYEGILVQEYIPGFDKKTMEHRIYTIGDKYAYTVLTQQATEYPSCVVEEGGKVKSPQFQQAKKLAARVCKMMPKTVIQGVRLGNMLMRSDIGYRAVPGKTQKSPSSTELFLSEQEFVPSLYARECPRHIYPEKLVGDSILNITRQYISGRQRAARKRNRHRCRCPSTRRRRKM